MVYIKHSKHVPFEYTKITKNIFIGSNQCCQVHFKKSLLDKGIKADISLEKESLDSPFGVSYFLWIPVKDHKSPTQKQLLLGAEFLKSLVDKDIPVYVHCKRGHCRSPTLVAAFFILEGMNYFQAILKIRRKRKIHMARCQINALRSFDKKINNR